MNRLDMTLEYVEDKVFDGYLEQMKNASKDEEGFTKEEDKLIDKASGKKTFWKEEKKEVVQFTDEEFEELDLSQFNT